MSSMKGRVTKLERKAGSRGPRHVVVIRDDFGHEIWPPDHRPRDGDAIHEIVIGGIDVREGYLA